MFLDKESLSLITGEYIGLFLEIKRIKEYIEYLKNNRL